MIVGVVSGVGQLVTQCINNLSPCSGTANTKLQVITIQRAEVKLLSNAKGEDITSRRTCTNSGLHFTECRHNTDGQFKDAEKFKFNISVFPHERKYVAGIIISETLTVVGYEQDRRGKEVIID